MTKFVVGCADKLVPNSKVEREAFADAVVVLSEPCGRWNPVVVIADPTASFAEKRRAGQKALEIRW